MDFTIRPYAITFNQQVISVWENAVRETHHFLSGDDFEYYKCVVTDLDFTEFPVYCAVADLRIVGFIGVEANKVEMLFIDPSYSGKGIGKALIDFAVTTLNATHVDVNEQNEQALGFYLKMGFEAYERTDRDGANKPYPLLKMALKTRSKEVRS